MYRDIYEMYLKYGTVVIDGLIAAGKLQPVRAMTTDRGLYTVVNEDTIEKEMKCC